MLRLSAIKSIYYHSSLKTYFRIIIWHCTLRNKFVYNSVVQPIGSLGSISLTCLSITFTRADPKSTKRQSSHQCLCALLGSALIKAACKMLVKSTPCRHICH